MRLLESEKWVWRESKLILTIVCRNSKVFYCSFRFRYLSDKEVFDHDSLWYEGEPNNVGDNGENVGMIYSEGHFNDIHEEYVEYPSVCKKI